MTLRPYQQDIADRTRGAFSKGRRAPLICLATGGGKTVIFSYIAANAVAKGLRVWIIAHRKELINQAARTLSDFSVAHGIIKSGVTPWHGAAVQVASVQSLVGRVGNLLPPDLIVIDECHHATSAGYRKIIAACPGAKVIGVTATPARLDGKGLGEVFDEIILGPAVADLIAGGFLSPAKYFAPPPAADFSQVKIKCGDYETAGLENAMNRPAITGDAVEHYRKICDGQPMLSFCVSVKHAEDVAAQYRAAGYRAECVHGGLPADVRDDRIAGLANGKFQIITSCDLIGEGLDVPVVTAAQILRPTASLILHLQQIGRVLRVCEGKFHAIILDHVGNVEKHGFAHCDPYGAERVWSLAGRNKTKRKAEIDEEDVKIKSCPSCFAVHEPAPDCPFCGHVYPVKPRRLEIVKGNLEEIEAVKKARREEQSSARSLQDLIRIGRERGYKSPAFWAAKIWQARGRRSA